MSPGAYKFLSSQDHSLIILFAKKFLTCDFERALGSIRSCNWFADLSFENRLKAICFSKLRLALSLTEETQLQRRFYTKCSVKRAQILKNIKLGIKLKIILSVL